MNEQAKKVRSFKSDKAYKVRRSLCSDLNRLFIEAKREGYTNNDIVERIGILVYRNENFSRLPQGDQMYVLGYKDALLAELHQHLIFCLSIDGELLTSGETDALGALEKATGWTDKPGYVYPRQRFDADKSCYVYKDAAGYPRKDKPWNPLTIKGT